MRWLVRLLARKPCPSCGVRAVKLVDAIRGRGIDAAGRAFPYLTQSYRCDACHVELRELNNNGMVTRQAWDAGAREPIPKGTVLS